MKKISGIFSLSFLFMMTVTALYAQTRIVGNKQVQNVVRDVPAFTSIKKSGSIDLILVPAQQQKVTVVAESNIQDYVQTTVENGVLSIGMKMPRGNMTWRIHKLEVVVAVDHLEKLSLNGSGDVETRGTLSLPTLTIGKNGSGDMDLDIDAGTLSLVKDGSGDVSIEGVIKDLQIKAGSSGDMVLKGSAEKCSIVKSGSGDLEARHFKVGDMTLSNSGSGDAEIWADNNLSIKANGSGDVKYSGNAKIGQLEKTGSGDIKKY